MSVLGPDGRSLREPSRWARLSSFFSAFHRWFIGFAAIAATVAALVANLDSIKKTFRGPSQSPVQVDFLFGTFPSEQVLSEISLSEPQGVEGSPFETLKQAMQPELMGAGYAVVAPYENPRPGMVFRLSGKSRSWVAQIQLSEGAIQSEEILRGSFAKQEYSIELTAKDLGQITPLIATVEPSAETVFRPGRLYVESLKQRHPEVQTAASKLRELTAGYQDNIYLVVEVVYGRDSSMDFTIDSHIEDLGIGDAWPANLTRLHQENSFEFARVPLAIKVVSIDPH